MHRLARPIGLGSLLVASCARADQPAPFVDPYMPPPGELPSGVYSGRPLARLPGGHILWSTGDVATGTGVTQVKGADSDFGPVAAYKDGVLTCGIVQTRYGYFTGFTGRLSCRHYTRNGVVELSRSRGDRYQAPEFMLVDGDVLFINLGRDLVAYDLNFRRELARTRPERWPGQRLPDKSRGIGSSLYSDAGGLVHASLILTPDGYKVRSRRLALDPEGHFQVGEISTTAAPPLPARLGPRRVWRTPRGPMGFLHLWEYVPERLGCCHHVVQLAGWPAKARIVWANAFEASLTETILIAAPTAVTVVKAGHRHPPGQPVKSLASSGGSFAFSPDRPDCAADEPRRTIDPTVNFIEGLDGELEAVVEWSGKNTARCWQIVRARR